MVNKVSEYSPCEISGALLSAPPVFLLVSDRPAVWSAIRSELPLTFVVTHLWTFICYPDGQSLTEAQSPFTVVTTYAWDVHGEIFDCK